MSEENKHIIKVDDLSDLEGYTPCSRCGKVVPETTTTTAAIVTEPSVTTKPPETTTKAPNTPGKITAIINKNSGMYHLNADCAFVKLMNEENKHVIQINDLSELAEYTPCSRCGGERERETTTTDSKPIPLPTGNIMVIINLNSKMYHLDLECTYVQRMNEENKFITKVDNLSELEDYTPCSRCAGSVAETTTVAKVTETPETTTKSTQSQGEILTVIVNLNSKTFHADHNCRHIQSMNEDNKGTFTGTIEEIFAVGYKPCGTCSKQYINN